MTIDKDVLKLLEAVEALCNVWVGKKADGEAWLKTAERIEQLDKLAKRVRKSAS